jgi:AcrR family transcriptional regulator
MNQHSPNAPRLAPVSARGKRSREALLRAAEHVFGENGFDNASIAEICRHAGCALGSFYVYFPDKKAAFVELVDGLGQHLRQHLTDAIKAAPDRLRSEREGLLAYLRFVGDHKKLYRIVREAEFVDELAFRRYHDSFVAGYVAGLEHAMARGDIRRGDAEVMTHCLMGISAFLGVRWVLWESPSDENLERIVDAAFDMISHGLSTSPKPPAAPATRAKAKTAKAKPKAARPSKAKAATHKTTTRRRSS